MRIGFLGSLVAVLASASLVLAQAETKPASSAPAPEHSLDPTQPAESNVSGPPGFMDRVMSPLNTEEDDYGRRFRASAEALLWWVKDSRPVLPLLTVGNALEDFESGLVSGHEGIDYNLFTGGRLTLGYGFDDEMSSFVEGRFFFLGKRSVTFRNDISPILARPFFDFRNRVETSSVVAFPGIAAGSIAGSTTSQTWGTEANIWKNVVTESVLTPIRFDVMAGVRYLEVGEDLGIGSVTNYNLNIDPATFPRFVPFAGDRITATDNFLTRNQFVGGQVGAATKFWIENLVIDIQTKVAMGTTHEEIVIDGSQSRFRPLIGRSIVSRGGLLALPSNIGRFHKEQFSLLSEVTTNLNIPITKRLTLIVGYNLTFLDKVVRPSDQIDRALDTVQIPNFPGPGTGVGLGRPAVPFSQSNFWVQGLNLGFEITW